jgi:uncharacterized protein YjbI with pentapeptide repeats
MYAFEPCGEPDCRRAVFAGGKTCLAHARNPESLVAAAAEALRAGDEIRDLNLAGARLEGLNLGGKTFICCSFINTDLRNLLFTGARFRLCLFDRASIAPCVFSRLDAQFSSFGAARIDNSSFENSELLHVNFCGAEIHECTFNNSNLYDSRFIGTVLAKTDFVDCDLKRVHLIPAKEVEVSYKYSNIMEATRDLEHLYL